MTASIFRPSSGVAGAVCPVVPSALASPLSASASAITISKLSLRGEIALGVAPCMASGRASLVTPSARASGRTDGSDVSAFSWLKAGSETGGRGADGAADLPAKSGMHHLSVGSWPCGASTSGPTFPFPGDAAVSDDTTGGGAAGTPSLFMAPHRSAKKQAFPQPIPCAGWSPRRAHQEPRAPARTLQWSWTRG